MKKKNTNRTVSRRDFLAGTAATVASFTIVPRYVLGGNGNVPPSEKLNIASIGAGGMAGSNIEKCSNENIVAMADVDDRRAAETYAKFPNATKFVDFRVMLDKMHKDIDAVIVATPDHTHAIAAISAMLLGKHVYVQKPLTHSISETRRLQAAAKEYNVVTQMGNQGHSGEGIRLICEWIADGAIGAVREVHAWTNRPVWPQGIVRPKGAQEVPSELNWDLWLGTAPYRDYNSLYVPFNWRGWWDFGTGALGDMACHILDPVFWALKLGSPERVEATATKCIDSKDNGDVDFVNCDDCCPLASMVHFRYPARGDMPALSLHWYDGGMMPPRPEELEPDRQMGDRDGGVLFVGDKGKLMCGCYARGPRLIPETAMQAYQRPEKTIPRVEGGMDGHEKDWIRACKEGTQPSSNFDMAAPLTEGILLGCVAVRTGKSLKWDGPNMTVTNEPEANQFVQHHYRDGWTL